MRRFEMQEGTSSKFWEISLEGNSFTVRYGRIGTGGQSSTKSFADAAEARAQHDKLVAEKVKKGYAELGGAASSKPAGGPQLAKLPAKKAISGKAKSLKVFADYHQVHVLDRDTQQHLGDAWNEQTTEQRIAVEEQIIGIGTARNMTVPVEVEILDQAPVDDAEKFDHVTECSLEVPTGALLVMGCTDELSKAHSFAVPPGTVRVRASHSGLGSLSEDGLKGKDVYRLAIWPGPKCEPRVIKQWVPPEPVAKPSIKAPKTPKQAVAVAREGRTDDALPKLLELSAKGNGLAGASSAEIMAFRGDWRAVIQHAGVFIKDLHVIGACNVFDEMLELLRRAVHETGAKKEAAAAVEGMPADAVRLADTAKRFLTALEKGTLSKVSLGVETSLLPADEELLDLAQNSPQELEFEDAIRVARVWIAKGKEAEAWALIESRVSAWSGGFVCSVAPVELLLDKVIGPIMTRERCAMVLATPRSQ